MAESKKVAPEPIIFLKVHGFNNDVTEFKIKIHTPMNKLMKSYCDRTGLDMASIRFRFDGQSFSGEATPFSLKLENNDIIEVFQYQSGGSFYFNY